MSKPVTGKTFDYNLLSRVFSYTLPYRRLFYFACSLTIASALVSPLRPMLVQYTLDHYIAFDDLTGLTRMMLLLAGILIVHATIEYGETFLTNLIGQSVVRDLRVKLFRHILNFKPAYFDRTPVGTLQTRAISDMETIGDIFSEGLMVMIADILQLVVILGVMFWSDWRLSLVSLSTIPLLLIATKIFQEGIRKTFQDVRTQVAALNTFVQEHITGMSVVQVFNREATEMKKFREINQRHADAHIRSVWYYSVFFPVVEILSATSIGLLVWWGIKGVMDAHASFGTIVAFIMYLNMVFRPVRELADKFNTLQMGMVSSERIFKVFDTVEQIKNEGKFAPEKISGDVVFDHVKFRYSDDADAAWILKGISFELKAGSTLALVGATGSGKTSIINLLSRFYEIGEGKIMLDGHDIREYELTALRSHMALVLQDVFLFSGSILENITLKDSRISREAVIDASRKIGAHEFIMALPGNYDFNAGERGATLSAGQRQLVSFIRAYVHNPAILILDEATSSIDTESEVIVQKAITTLTEGRTSIVIAHRLSTIQKADKILVLDHGEIIESGTHASLMKLDGAYKKLYEIQFKEDTHLAL